MTRIVTLIFSLILVCPYLSAQDSWRTQLKLVEFDSSIHERLYEVDIEDYQVLQLIELKNGDFKGVLTNAISSSKDQDGHLKRDVQNISITQTTVEKLMKLLKQNDFETIPDDCSYNQTLDGSMTTFVVNTNSLQRSYSYWELESDYYHREPNISPELRKVRKIMDAINAEFNLKQQLKTLVKILHLEQQYFHSIFMDVETEKGTKAFRIFNFKEDSKTKRVTKQLEKHGFTDIQIIALEQVDHFLTAQEKNNSSHEESADAFKSIISQEDYNNLPLTETLYYRVKFVEKAHPDKLRLVKLDLSFKFQNTIQ
ncbi:hypothetical protein [Formosa sp. S-31]|uniref:hypothetical protein n=1 Tax=Formosa sp. S-31 TaxID=2790949 RepID=UPI003EC03094